MQRISVSAARQVMGAEAASLSTDDLKSAIDFAYLFAELAIDAFGSIREHPPLEAAATPGVPDDRQDALDALIEAGFCQETANRLAPAHFSTTDEGTWPHAIRE